MATYGAFPGVPVFVVNAGNVAVSSLTPFDVIFPLIVTPFTDAAYRLSSHPKLEAWGNSTLTGYGSAQGDNRVFWVTSPAFDQAGATPSGSLRAISIEAQSGGETSVAPANWASTTLSRGSGDVALGACRILDSPNVVPSSLPLLNTAATLLGNNNLTAKNRTRFNIALAVHSLSEQVVAGAFQHYFTIRYTFAANDPLCIIRANSAVTDTITTPTQFNPSNPGGMASIAGDDDALGVSLRKIRFAETGSTAANPYMTRPLVAFPTLKYSDQIAVVAGP